MLELFQPPGVSVSTIFIKHRLGCGCSPAAALIVVDEDGRLLFHNASLRELLGSTREELDLIDTRRFWHDLDHRTRVVEILRARGGNLLDEEVIWRSKNGTLVHVLMSYVQVAYQGGHVSFAGGKRLSWVYDVTALKLREAQIADQERQFRQILEFCPAGLNVVDEDGRLLFHNARAREPLGYDADEMELFDTKRFLARPRSPRSDHPDTA